MRAHLRTWGLCTATRRSGCRCKGGSPSRKSLREALRLRPDDVDVLNELGVAVWRQGRAGRGRGDLPPGVSDLAPNDFRILTNLGLALYELGRIDEAGDYYRRALQIRPDTFEAVMNLGIVLSDQGRFDEAAVWLEAALQLRPDSADALHNIGMNLGRQGRWARGDRLLRAGAAPAARVPRRAPESCVRAALSRAITSAAGRSMNGA